VPNLNLFGKIDIDNYFIGFDAILMPNITIGPNSVVGDGSVVTKDIPSNMVVAGVPARILCRVDEYKEKCINSYNNLTLRGPRNTWKNQLIELFWNQEPKQ
jgi:serine acetyltransferase